MKKIIISTFLVVSLFAVSVVPTYAVAVVDDAAVAGLIIEATVAVKESFLQLKAGKISDATFQKQLNIYKSFWGTPAANSYLCTISYDSLCELCIDLNQSQSCRLYYNSTLGGYVIRAQNAYTCYYNGTKEVVWDNTYSTLRNSAGQFYFAVYNTDSLINQIQLNTDQIEGYIDQIEGRIGRTVDGTVYTVADSAYNHWQLTKSLQPYIESAAGRLVMTTSDGVKHTVAESTYWGYQELITANTYLANMTNINTKVNNIYSKVSSMKTATDTINTNVESAANRLLVATSDGVQHTVAESAYWGYQQLVTANGYLAGLDSIVSDTSLIKAQTRLMTNQLSDISYNITDDVCSKLDTINDSINNLDITVTVEDNDDVDVFTTIQQNGEDVDNGVDTLSKILDLVREFFNSGAETNWRGAKDYAMHWGSDVE